jgi:hypothetical protein
MFYQAEKIESILICNVCENKMVDPRLLPCGKSVCHKCVDLLVDTDKQKIKCQNCAKTHEIPDDGFSKNLALQKLLEFEAKEVLQSNHVVNFKKFLEILDKTKQSIQSTLECGDATIRNHCEKVRNEMQLAIEQAHAKLDEIHKDFMDEIDNHEKECQAKFKTIQQNKVDIEKAINETNELLSQSNRLLNHFKIDQTELSKLFESARSLQTNLEQIKDGIQIEMFNESLLKFEKQKSFDSNVIGKIVRQNIKLYFLENIENMRELKNFVPKTKFTLNFPYLQSFKSNGYLSLYSDNNILNLLCLDKGGNILFEKKDLIKNKKKEEISNLIYVSTKNNKIVYIYTHENLTKPENELIYLRSLDENFNLLAKIKLDEEPIDFDVNGENLFLLNKNTKFCTISIYNQNLEIFQKFGQKNSLLPFYFSSKADVFFVINQYFIINERIGEYQNSATIINRSNGLVESTFDIYEKYQQIRLYLDKYLLIFYDEICLLQCYNFKGDLLHEITLDKKLKGSDIVVINKELCFVLKDNNKIYIF